MNDPSPLEEVLRLERLLASLQSKVDCMEALLHNDHEQQNPRIFVAKPDEEGWAEQVINGADELATHGSGRHDDGAHTVEDADAFLLVEQAVPGTSPGVSGTRWVRIGTASGTMMRITGATQDGTARRWTYSLRKVTKAAAGHAGWELDPADTAVYVGYNHAESINDQGGAYFGNGLPMVDLPAGFDLLPFPAGRDVECTPRVVGGVVEYWFDRDNMVGGECE